MDTSARKLALVLAVTTLAGCGSSTVTSSVESTQPRAIPSPSQEQPVSDVASLSDDDDLMCRLERRFDGFAGVVQKRDGTAEFLFSKDAALSVLEELKHQLVDRGFGIIGTTSLRRVRYDFCTLRGWYEPLSNEVFEINGVVLTDIDERLNRILVGVVDGRSSEDEIRRIAAEFGIPREALAVEQVEPYGTDVLAH